MHTLAEQMKAHALEAQKFSRKHLVLELDFSEASVEDLGNQFDSLEYAIRGGKSPENVSLLTRLWGAYIGESLRRATDAQWIEEVTPAGRRMGLRGRSGKVIYPHEHVHKRLLDKSAGDIVGFFQTCLEILRS